MIKTVKPELFSGEHIAWEGQPYSGLILRPMEVFLIPFSLLWGGFALFWNASVWTTDADVSFKLFGLPFLIAGLYFTVGRFVIDMILRRKMSYFVTNKRIIIERQSGGAKIKSVDISRPPALELDERSDGSGTIRFGNSGGWFSGNNFGIWQPTFDPTPQFIRIPNVRSVYQLIQKQSDA
ncbi:PH domain-containing protein [Sphingomonas solaris]|uniref:PH domain-containing protein n=1 Tax=Alterirhizorhabdus solaris TaxID=2529389 RepID=A0A558QX55_9SPHN|nr:PH domain-containing protein [Sphingomonas solaris]TVV71659.1 PH domain-containing protein [Sphingomonas solaris]